MKGLRGRMVVLGRCLDQLHSRVISVEVTFEQRQKNRASHRRNTPGRVSSRCKGPGVRISLIQGTEKKAKGVAWRDQDESLRTWVWRVRQGWIPQSRICEIVSLRIIVLKWDFKRHSGCGMEVCIYGVKVGGFCSSSGDQCGNSELSVLWFWVCLRVESC